MSDYSDVTTHGIRPASRTVRALPSNRYAVTRVDVRRLFGRYDYTLPGDADRHTDLSRALILYGGNGSGKTTILKIVFDLLSAADDRGHRTRLFETPFAYVRVTLADGTTVTASRPDGSVEGPFQMELARDGTVTASAAFLPRDQRSPEADRGWQRFVEALSKVDLDVYFLSDDRRVESDKLPREEEQRLTYRFSAANFERGEAASLFGGTDARADELKRAIDRMVGWLRQQTLSAANIGDANVNTIYADIVRRISASPRAEDPAASQESLSALESRIARLAHRSEKFARYGLVSPFGGEELLTALRGATDTTHRVVAHVLQPHLDSLQARFDALESIQRLMATLETSINSFYTDKQLRIDLRTGMRVATPDGTVLRPDMLSSGERQLMLLLCETVYARERATIFIIDEPELSLNVNWQRRLVDALLQCAEGSAVQFMLATHSIELLATHEDHVVTLTPQTAEKIPLPMA